jgi:hypothetical protein
MTCRRIGRLIRRPPNTSRPVSTCPEMVRISMAFRSQSCNDQRPCTGVCWRGVSPTTGLWGFMARQSIVYATEGRTIGIMTSVPVALKRCMRDRYSARV